MTEERDPMKEQDTTNVSLVRSYLTLRKAIGIVGFALPIVLIIGKMLFQGPGIQDSVSGYYYTVMRDVLVGSLCAIGVFLWSYKGYPRSKDNLASNLAGASAIGVALFPTTPGSDATTLNEYIGEEYIGLLHVVFAATFFSILAFISIWLFTKHDPAKGDRTPQKLQRDRVYRACGWTILVCIALIAAVWFLPSGSPIRQLHPVLWLEAAAIWAFGLSWFTKGEGILRDGET
jgi:hypothetical protein